MTDTLDRARTELSRSFPDGLTAARIEALVRAILADAEAAGMLWKSRAEAAEKALRDMIGADWEGKP